MVALSGFPLLKRLTSLLVNDNAVKQLNFARSTPNLKHLVLANNDIDLLGDLDKLQELKWLESLVLLGNPVCKKKHYRLYVVHKLPRVNSLDFKRVLLKEKREAKRIFGSKTGKEFESALREAAAEKEEVISEKALPEDVIERRAAIRKAIMQATTKEEIDKLEALLSQGVLPVNEPAVKRQKI